jgi:transcription initiation factor TFIIF subunit alpha
MSQNLYCSLTPITLVQERIKKEYRKANNTQDTNESDEEDQPQLTGAGKAMQKVLKKTDKSGQYDESDDDEKNPYASSVSKKPR